MCLLWQHIYYKQAHTLNLERYREDQRGRCTGMTGKFMKCSVFIFDQIMYTVLSRRGGLLTGKKIAILTVVRIALGILGFLFHDIEDSAICGVFQNPRDQDGGSVVCFFFFSFNNKTSSNFLPQHLAQACRFIWSHWGFAYVLLHPFLSHLEKSSFS